MSAADQINTWMRRIPAWPIYLISPTYAGWLLWLGLTGGLGAEPIKALEHALGEVALYLLVIGLGVTPLRRWAGVNLLKYRRAIGLACFFFVSLHLLTWLVLDLQALDRIWADIVKRPYITVGMIAFVLMVPLAATSNNLSIRKMGIRWKQLHKLMYLVAVLAGIHYVMLVKGLQLRPLIFLGVIVLLIAVRFHPFGRLTRA